MEEEMDILNKIGLEMKLLEKKWRCVRRRPVD